MDDRVRLSDSRVLNMHWGEISLDTPLIAAQITMVQKKIKWMYQPLVSSEIPKAKAFKTGV